MKKTLFAILVFGMSVFLLPAGSQAGKVLYGAESAEPYFTQLDPSSGIDGFSSYMPLVGTHSVQGMMGAAADPMTGEIYLVLDTEEAFHRLIKFDPRTTEIVDIGNLGDLITGLAFDSSGTLYGVTSDDVSGTEDTIFTINTSTAALTFFMNLPAPDGYGDTIAYNPDDGKLYHWTGYTTTAFQAIDLTTKTSVSIPLSGAVEAGVGVRSFVYDTTQNLFVGYREDEFQTTMEFFSITPGGVLAYLSPAGYAEAGMVFYDADLLPPVASPRGHRHLYSVDIFSPYITTVDPSTGLDTGTRAITMTGYVVTGSNGLAVDPTSGEFYVAVKVTTGGRRLATIDPRSGVTTEIGNLAQAVAGLAFGADGTLYAVSGEGGNAPETLFTVNKANSQLTVFQTLSDDDAGEAIAFNSDDGQLYRASGWNAPILQKINLSTNAVTSVTLSGDVVSGDEVTGLTYDPDQGLFLGTKWVGGNFAYFSLTPTGVESNLNMWNSSSLGLVPKKGYAFSLGGIVSNDFDGDGKSDILWRNVANGKNAFYAMNGSSFASNYLNQENHAGWQIVGTGDFDGDGDSDILWRNASTGVNVIYAMNGTSFSSLPLNTEATLSWEVAGTGDFDGDGDTDILWRNAASGKNVIYLMNGLSIDSQYVNQEPDLTWHVAGTGDFDGDGKTDILWRNAVTGRNVIYTMNGSSFSSLPLNQESDLNWQVVGTGDFDGDGDDDILWRHSLSGVNVIYLMNGSLFTSQKLNQEDDLNWVVAGTGDYDGDGDADILWRHATTGKIVVYILNSLSIDSQFVHTESELNWQIVNVD